jgi:hypothetical protein
MGLDGRDVHRQPNTGRMLLRIDGLEEGSRACQVSLTSGRLGSYDSGLHLAERFPFVPFVWTRLPRAQNTVVQEYRLPDFTPANPRGYIMSGPNAVPQSETEDIEAKAAGGDENVVTMGNERFSVPEVVFNPRDIGKHNTTILFDGWLCSGPSSRRLTPSGACRDCRRSH